VKAAVLALVTIIAVATGCRVPYTGGAHPVAANDSLRGYIHAAPTPVVRQHQQADCGLAALAMMAGAWGRSWNVDDLARKVPPKHSGVQLGALRDLARSGGLDAYSFEGTLDDLHHELEAGRPVLVGLLLPFEGNRFLGHYEVAIAMDPKSGEIVTLDPATGKSMRRARDALEYEWSRAKHATLVVVGPLSVQRSTTIGETP